VEQDDCDKDGSSETGGCLAFAWLFDCGVFLRAGRRGGSEASALEGQRGTRMITGTTMHMFAKWRHFCYFADEGTSFRPP
jgi:hypothetical protein